MKHSDAKRKGFEIVMKPKKPKAPEQQDLFGPAIQVTVDNKGIAEAIESLTHKLEPQIIEVGNSADVQALRRAIEVSNRAVIAAAKKIPGKKLVKSCEMVHEYDSRSRPTITHVTFEYEDAT